MNETNTDNPKRVRFVILHHQPDPREHSPSATNQFPEHWDFMVEQAETLATWQLQSNPTTNPTATINAKRIADHRRAYLEYEGPISQNRGQVQRIESGTCAVLESSTSRWILDLQGQHLNGKHELNRVAHLLWRWGKR